jgi:hypothetical protein
VQRKGKGKGSGIIGGLSIPDFPGYETPQIPVSGIIEGYSGNSPDKQV